MKLKKENFNKYTLPDGAYVYSYTCLNPETQETTTIQVRQSKSGDIYVYKNDEFDTNLQNTFVTKDKLEAWNKFEEMLNACQPQQGSSGGFMRNPQNNPQIVPLLAIKQIGKKFSITLFGMQIDGNQVKGFEFEVDEEKLNPIQKDKVFVRDFSDVEDLPDLFKCELLFRYTEKIKLEEDKNADVFFFIPKQIVQQGSNDDGDGDEQGKVEKGKEKTKDMKPKEGIQKPKPSEEDGEPTDEDGEPTDEEGKPTDKKGKKKGKGKPTDEEGEPTDEDGEPTDEEGKPTDKDGEPTDDDKKTTDGGTPSDKKGKRKGKGKPTDEEGEPTDEEGEPTDEDGEPSDEEKKERENATRKYNKIDRPQLLEDVSNVVGMPPNVLESFFSRVNSGETFLLTNNFEQIKKSLNLPPNTTARDLATEINKQL